MLPNTQSTRLNLGYALLEASPISKYGDLDKGTDGRVAVLVIASGDNKLPPTYHCATRLFPLPTPSHAKRPEGH